MGWDLAVVASLFVVGHILFGHFEAQTPRWRKLLKFAIAMGFTAVAGREIAAWTFGVLLVGVVYIHGWWLPHKHGINGWTAEPKERYYRFRGWEWPPRP